MTPFAHRSTGRSLRAALILCLVWMALLTLWMVFGATPWIVGLLFATTLPAAWDFANGRQAVLLIDSLGLSWRSGRNCGEIALARIRTVRLETRLDMSIRMRILTDDGQRITLPQDCVPPVQSLETTLGALGIKTERHHFAFLPGV